MSFGGHVLDMQRRMKQNEKLRGCVEKKDSKEKFTR